MPGLKSRKLLFASLLAILLLGSAFFPAHSQQVIEFKNHHADTTFLENIRFTVDLCGLPEHAGVSLHVRFSHEGWESIGAFVDKATPTSCARGRYTYPMEDYPPFLPVEYYWQVIPQEGGIYEGPHQSALYEDTRYQWQKLESGNITVYWHDRPTRLGEQVLAIAKEADQLQSRFFGLELNNPYRIVIFNSADEFFGWNVDSDDYVAGEAYPFFDLTVQIMEEDDDRDWLNDLIPHEISHLYFNQATFHPKPESDPPSWLNEGVAVYNELSDHSFEDQILGKAVRADGLIPLYELANSFGDDHDRVDLAYAEGYSAVSYLMEQYGRDTLKKIMNSYRRGDSTEEVFAGSIDKTPEAFEMDWRAWLKKKYSKEMLPPPIETLPVPDRTPSAGYKFLYLVLCTLGLIPLLCLVTVVAGVFLALLIRQSLKS
ncbi:MAG: peptidase MA family metallohydrolase [Bacteroidota bacterium]|jgi:hypothetical protein